MITATEYLSEKETVRGWLQDLDARVFLAVNELQRARAIAGDLLEVGVFYGRSAILLGYCVQPGERLTVCDPFYEANYRRFHNALPEIIAAPSITINREAHAGCFRLIHVDGNHGYADVCEDIVTARRLLGPGGVVILDD